MGSNARASGFLKECMADALIQLIPQKEFSRITVNEIAAAAGVNRSTWFRHFETKNDALTFKLVQLWLRYTAVQTQISQHYTLENAHDFFKFTYQIRELLTTIYQAGAQSAVYSAFYQIMISQQSKSTLEAYAARFYSYGLFGLLDEWYKREFHETPDEMTQLFRKMI